MVEARSERDRCVRGETGRGAEKERGDEVRYIMTANRGGGDQKGEKMGRKNNTRDQDEKEGKQKVKVADSGERKILEMFFLLFISPQCHPDYIRATR